MGTLVRRLPWGETEKLCACGAAHVCPAHDIGFFSDQGSRWRRPRRVRSRREQWEVHPHRDFFFSPDLFFDDLRSPPSIRPRHCCFIDEFINLYPEFYAMARGDLTVIHRTLHSGPRGRRMAMEMLLELTLRFRSGRRRIIVEEGDPILLEAAQAIQLFLTNALDTRSISLPGLLHAPVAAHPLMLPNGPTMIY